ncbi:MAG TPA: hypothetical protein DD411_17315 [Alcanivorax sp.]|nr:hypothetical protein [Alcanivorax sp.]
MGRRGSATEVRLPVQVVTSPWRWITHSLTWRRKSGFTDSVTPPAWRTAATRALVTACSGLSP